MILWVNILFGEFVLKTVNEGKTELLQLGARFNFGKNVN